MCSSDLDGKARFTLIDMAKQKPIADKDGKIDESIDPVAENAYGSGFDVVRTDKNGRQIGKAELAHNFNPDPHYRTTGQFLGSRPRS